MNFMIAFSINECAATNQKLDSQDWYQLQAVIKVEKSLFLLVITVIIVIINNVCEEEKTPSTLLVA